MVKMKRAVEAVAICFALRVLAKSISFGGTNGMINVYGNVVAPLLLQSLHLSDCGPRDTSCQAHGQGKGATARIVMRTAALGTERGEGGVSR